MKTELALKLIEMLVTGGSDKPETSNSKSMLNEMVGKYVIVRSRNEGINAGIVKDLDSTGIVLSQARRIWYHKPEDKNMAWYEGVAESGLASDSKTSIPVREKAIIEDYSITVCSDIAKNSISGHKAHEQS